MNVTALARNRHPLLVGGSLRSVKVKNALGVVHQAAVQKVAANHDPRPAFSGLAVNGGHVERVLGQPRLHVFAEGPDEREGRWVVVVEGVVFDAAVKLPGVVDLLGAEVVDFVVILVLVVEKLLNLVQRVSVEGLQVLGGVPHGDDAIADVGEVEVVTIFDVSQFLFTDQSLQSAGHPDLTPVDERYNLKNGLN